MRLLFLLTDISREEANAALAEICPSDQHSGPWAHPPGIPFFYISHRESSASTPGHSPAVTLMIEVSDRLCDDGEVRSFVLVLLSRLLGVVQDNYTKHDWTAEEIESGMTIQGHRFFDRHGWNEELRTRDLSFPLTQAQAAQLVHATVNEGTPDESERIVTEVEEREFGWVVHWTSRLWWETRDFQHAIAGNVPYYVTRKDGRLVQLGTVGNDEIIAVLERQLAADDEEDHEA